MIHNWCRCVAHTSHRPFQSFLCLVQAHLIWAKNRTYWLATSMDKFRLALLQFIFGVKIGTESQRSRETEITQGRITSKTENRLWKGKERNRWHEKRKIGLYIQERLSSGEKGIQEGNSRKQFKGIQDPTPTLGCLLDAGGGQWRAAGNLDNFSKAVSNAAPHSYAPVQLWRHGGDKQNWEPVPCAVFPSKSVCGYHPSQSCTNPKLM